MRRPPLVPPSVASTAREYAEVATVHGVSYIANTKASRVERLLWTLLLLLLLGLSLYLGLGGITDYQTNRVITTLGDTTKPITDLSFPAITICSKGLNMEAVKLAVEQDYVQWSSEQMRRKREVSTGSSVEEFMRARFGVGEDGANLLDVLQAMAAPHPAAATSNAVRENLVACSQEQALVTRRKRHVRQKRAKPVRDTAWTASITAIDGKVVHSDGISVTTLKGRTGQVTSIEKGANCELGYCYYWTVGPTTQGN